jgi:hypothetical protein
MLINLLLGLPVMAVCLVLQAILIAWVLAYYLGHVSKATGSGRWGSVGVLLAVMVMLVIGNLVQVVVWACLFYALGEFQEFSDATYHSGVNFASLGYGDIVMSEKHRLLGPIEAINGVLMMGVSTAVLMSTIQDVLKKRIALTSGDR